MDGDAGEMRAALAAISNEIQRFQSESIHSSPDEMGAGEEAFSKLLQCKSSLKSKREEIQKLKQHLKTAYYIAKTLSSAKEKEAALLNNHLTSARKQYCDVVQQHKQETGKLKQLTSENEILRDNLEYFTRSIDGGYHQLQKMRNESVENIPTLKKLKELILCCGQYYADYCNERNKNSRLEQKNRFLNNKLRILQCNQGPSPDFFSNQNRKDKMLERDEQKYKQLKARGCVNIGVVCSEYQLGQNTTNLTMTKIEVTKTRDLDLSTHLDLIKKLLHNQDILLKDLNYLSNEITMESL